MKYVSGHVRRENLPANTKTCRVFFRWESYLTKNRIDNAVFREVCSKYRTWDERFSFAKGKATKEKIFDAASIVSKVTKKPLSETMREIIQLTTTECVDDGKFEFLTVVI